MWNQLKRFFKNRGRKRRPNAPAKLEQETVSTENILIFSDLHLGEACKNWSRIDYLKQSDRLDQQLCDFLDYYSKNRVNDQPWKLICCGDFIDFLQITMTPPEVSEEEAPFGLGTQERESVWKLERLMERHHRAFVYLAAFVGMGNRLELIRGNHDEEFFWPAVRQSFIQHLSQIYFGLEERDAQKIALFESRIHFCHWFYYQPGVLYAEHGHRFDAYCATWPQLCPLHPLKEQELFQPISALGIRYFANLEPGFSTHDKEHWGIVDYLKYYKSSGLKHFLVIFGRYVRCIYFCVRDYFQYGRLISSNALQQHLDAFSLLETEFQLSKTQIEQLDQQSVTPIIQNGFGVYVATSLPEWTGFLALALTAIIAILGDFSWMTAILSLSVVCLLCGLWISFCHRRHSAHAHLALLEKVSQLARIIEVPLIVLGHAHRPFSQHLPHRSIYMNTGAFLEGSPDAMHRPEEHCCCSNTFIQLIESDVGPLQPTLMRWCSVCHRPVPFGSTPEQGKG